MSAFIADFIKTSGLPALAVAILFFVTGGRADPVRARLQAVFLALGFVGGSYVIYGRLQFPPYDVNEAFSCVALALAVFVTLAPQIVSVRYLLRAILVIAFGFLCLWQIRDSLGGPVNLRNELAFFFLGLGVWSILEKAPRQVSTLTLIVLPLITATFLSVLLLLKGSASMAQQLGVLCAVLGGVLGVCVVSPKRVSPAAVVPFVSILVILFMAAGHFYLDINPWFMVYLCVPYFVMWIRNWIPLLPKKPVAEAAVLGVISALPLGYFMWNLYKSAGSLF